MFQRRHFEAIASEVMTWDKTETKAQIVLNLVAFFIHYNPNFNEKDPNWLRTWIPLE